MWTAKQDSVTLPRHLGLPGLRHSIALKTVYVAERPWYREEAVEEPDPVRELRRNARNAHVVKERIAGMLKVVRSAAPVDPDADALWRLMQRDFHDNQRVIGASLHARGALRAGR
jgi:hypothetical protein